MKKLWALFVRDAIENMTYKLAFAIDAASVATQLLTFYFIARLLPAGSSALVPYGGDYFRFVLVGLAFYGYQSAAMSAMSAAITREQDAGTLEAVLLTGTGFPTIVVTGLLQQMASCTLRCFGFLAAACLIFGVRFEAIHLGSFVLIAGLTVTALAGAGLASAGFALAFKRGDPAAFLLNSASKFLSGTYFPVSLLPTWMLPFAKALPLTHALEGARKALLTGASPAELMPQLVALALFSALFLPLGIFVFSRCVHRAKAEGSLAFV